MQFNIQHSTFSILLASVFCLLTTLYAGPLQTAFNAGECSDMVLYRVDLAQYAAACRQLENMTVAPQGTAVRRPGTEFVGDADDGPQRLIAFEAGDARAYVIRLSEARISFYTDGGEILEE